MQSQTDQAIRGVFDDDEARSSGGRDLVKFATLGHFDLRRNVALFVVPPS